MAPRGRRTRPCESCRSRHLKCDGDAGGNHPCSNCKRSNTQCIHTSKKFRFKHSATSPRTSEFLADQPWVDTDKTQLSFFDETDDVTRASASTLESSAPGFGSGRDSSSTPVQNENTAPNDRDHQLMENPLPSPSNTGTAIPDGLAQPNVGSDDLQSLLHTSPEDVSPLVRPGTPFVETFSPIVIGTTPSAIALSHPAPVRPLSVGLQEACLIRHYVQYLAHAFDTTDRDAHFTVTVPQRAMHSPVLLYAICTAAARHLTSLWSRQHPEVPIIYSSGTCLSDLTVESAIHYHNVCLSLLMDFTNIPTSEANAEERADALAATTILRFYEQLDTSLTGLDAEAYQSVVHTVMCTHHAESLFTLKSIEKQNRDKNGCLIIADGLRASACLIALRQEIWSVLLYRRPFRLPLSSDLDYSQLAAGDDFIWTNRMIIWCADVLRYCFGPDTATSLASGSSSLAFERWDSMKAFEERWTSSPPSSFEPLYYVPSDPAKGQNFPTIWQINDCQVQCLMHLELGSMLLAVYNPRRQRVGIGSSAMNKAIEEQLRQSVLRICGLALSNKKCQAGMTTAAIGISVGGECFHRSEEQEAIIDFLKILDEEHAWPTQSVVLALKEAWSLQHSHTPLPVIRGPASV